MIRRSPIRAVDGFQRVPGHADLPRLGWGDTEAALSSEDYPTPRPIPGGRPFLNFIRISEPDCPRAHALLGIHFGEQQDNRGALAELSKAHALAPADGRIALSLAQAELDASDLAGAEAIARQVIAAEAPLPRDRAHRQPVRPGKVPAKHVRAR